MRDQRSGGRGGNPKKSRRFTLQISWARDELAGAYEDHTLSRLRGLRSDLIDPAIGAHKRRSSAMCPPGAIGKHKVNGRSV
jgi:hypothetical protein